MSSCSFSLFTQILCKELWIPFSVIKLFTSGRVFRCNLSPNLHKYDFIFTPVVTSSFVCITIWEVDSSISRLDVAFFNPDTPDTGMYSIKSKKLTHRAIFEFNFPLGTEIAIPHRRDMAFLYPLSFSLAYIDQFTIGLSFPIFPFLMEILENYGIVFAQMLPNGIRVIVSFYIHCLKNGVAPTIALFRTFFYT